MNTPTHFLMTAALRRVMPRVRIPRWAVWFGSVAPDLPLFFLAAGGYLYFTRALGWSEREAWRHVWGPLFFEDPVWLALHNVLHAPLILIPGIAIAGRFAALRPRLSVWLRWFFSACLLHSLVDILTHFDDGPLVLWPLNWSYRFPSPVSYWDREHFGREFARFELALTILLIGFLFGAWAWERFATRPEPIAAPIEDET